MVTVTGTAQFVPDALVVNELQLQGTGTTSASAIAGAPSAPQGPLALADTGQATIASGLGSTSLRTVSASSSPTPSRRRATGAAVAAPVPASAAATSWRVPLVPTGGSTDDEASSSLGDDKLLTDVALSVIDSQTGDPLTTRTKKA
jgi:hypothetical protein